MNKDKARFESAMARLERGKLLRLTKNNQFWFGGNKFVKRRIATMCIAFCHDGMPDNNGGVIYAIDFEKANKRSR